MNGPLETLKQARDYAEGIEQVTGNKHHIFHVPIGSMAYNVGYRFGTCDNEDRPLYLADGAVFVVEQGEALPHGNLKGSRTEDGENDDPKEPATKGSSEAT